MWCRVTLPSSEGFKTIRLATVNHGTTLATGIRVLTGAKCFVAEGEERARQRERYSLCVMREGP